MALGGFFRKLIGGGGGSAGEVAAGAAVEYQGYLIRPAPKPQGGQFITAGTIEKEFPDGLKKQTFIRADTHSSRDDASAHAISKAQQIINEQGDRLFQGPQA
jgi:hypothetical protein